MSHPFMDRVAVSGWPDSWERYHAHAAAPWSSGTMDQLVEFGFTQVQLNLAWGARPDDEPLNLEDLLDSPGVTGLKEYYGLLPGRYESDANLRATVLFLREPDLDEEAVLRRLAAPARSAALENAWRLASEAMERYPWDCSWMGRQIGRSRTDHALSAAILRPMVCPTPSWESTRGTIFMRTENTAARPWMLEDVGLRAQQASDLWQKALAEIARAVPQVDGHREQELRQWQRSLDELRRRAVAYACHLRMTLIAVAERERAAAGLPPRAGAPEEMRRVLEESRANHAGEWEEMDRALSEMDGSWSGWLQRWLLPAKDQASKGWFSLTSG